MSKNIKFILIIAVFLSACENSNWNTNSKPSFTKIEGSKEEIQVFDYEEISADTKNITKITIPEEKFYKNRYNQDQGVNANFKLTGDVENLSAKTYKIGDKKDKNQILGSVPIIKGNNVFLIDGKGVLSSRNLESPNEIFWEKNLNSENSEFIGGKIIFDYSVLYVALKTGKVIALSSATGDVLWEKDGFSFINSSPVILDESIIISNAKSESFALSINSGEILWEHKGTPEISSKSKSASPLVVGKNVVVSYPSGEVFLLDGKTGKEKWVAQSYSNIGVEKAKDKLSSISITPILDSGFLYVFSDNGLMIKLNATNGEIALKKDISVLERPILVGNHIYAVHKGKYLVAFDKINGKNNWVLPLPEIQSTKAYFSSPVIAGSKLLITNSAGFLHIINPRTGESEDKIAIAKDVFLPPVYDAGDIYLFSNNAELIEVK